MKNPKAILITLVLATAFVTALAVVTGSGIHLPAAVATKSDTGESPTGATGTDPENYSCDPAAGEACAPDNPACSGCSGCSCGESSADESSR